jgi:hypothetical protein
MPNITVFLDDETYRRARIWAADRGTSVSAVVKCILVTLPTRASNHKDPSPPPPESTAPQPELADSTPTDPPSTTPIADSDSPDASTPPIPAVEHTWIPGWGLTVLRAVCEQMHPRPHPLPPETGSNSTVKP